MILCLVALLAGCSAPPIPRPGGETTTTVQAKAGSETQPAAANKDLFNNAWDKLKDITVATSSVSSLSQLAERVGALRATLDKIDQQTLSAGDKQMFAQFDTIYWTYEDSLTLWAALNDSGKQYEGIALFRDGKPLVPRATEIVQLYKLTLQKSHTDPAVQYVPKNSIDKLWKIAYTDAANRLLPVFGT